jgi:pilus assembly protein CpaF
MFKEKNEDKRKKQDEVVEEVVETVSEETNTSDDSGIKYEFKAKTNEDLLQDIIEHFTVVDKKSLNLVQRGVLSKEDFLAQVKNFIIHRGISEEQTFATVEAFRKYIWGYHVLDDLIYNDDISDIKVIDENNVRIKRLGKRESTDICFASVNDYISFVNYIAIKNKTNISDINAIQTFTDKETNPKFILRFDVMTSFVTSTGTPYVHIRKIPKDKYSMNKLQELNMFNEETKQYLIEKAKTSTGILFTGKGASGKTTLMNAMLEEIPHDCSALVIQENEELFTIGHPEMMFQHIVTSRGEGKIQYDLSDLARNGLLIDLDYFIIGEIKGGEALYFLNAAYTGHKCWASVHGVNSTEAMDKLADYVKYESDYSKEDALRMLRGIKVVVFLQDFKVKEISEIVGWDEEAKNLQYKRIM